MSLLFISGFDDGAQTQSTKWTTLGGTLQTGGPDNRRYISLVGNPLRKNLAASETELVVGTRMRHTTSAFSSGNNQMAFMEDTTVHVAIRHTNDGSIRLFRGTTLIDQSDPGVWTFGNWSYIEMKAVIHDTTGSVVVNVDGTEVINFSGDTRNAGTGIIDNVQWNGAGSSVQTHVLDIYILDTAGSINNDFLGDCVVETIKPNGNGNYSQFTGSDGNSTDNYLLVDDAPTPDSDTTYVAEGTATEKDSYAMGDLSAVSAASVFGVQVGVFARHEGAGGTYRIFHRRSTTDTPGAAITPAASYRWDPYLLEQDPVAGPGAWTVTNVNGSEFGVEIVS